MDFINTLGLVYEGVLAGLLIALSCSMVGVYLLMRRLSCSVQVFPTLPLVALP